MSEFDQLLDGVEAALGLERELGVKAFPFDRSLLSPPAPAAPADAIGPQTLASPVVPLEAAAAPATAEPSRAPAASGRSRDQPYDFVFLHDRPLSEKGVVMMAKIINGLKRTVETTPIVLASPLPTAKVYVVLGGLALKKFFPELRGGPGQWLKSPGGTDVLVTYSPEYILRFDDALPAVREKKLEMWNSLKVVKQRVER